jgi:hypothetical protein
MGWPLNLSNGRSRTVIIDANQFWRLTDEQSALARPVEQLIDVSQSA